MRRHKRLLALFMSVMLVASMLPVTAIAGVVGDWQSSIFGSSTSLSSNTITPNADGTVTLSATNGKLASNEEGIAFYFKQLAAEDNFEITATAKVNTFNHTTLSSESQKSFGLMVRDGVGVNGSNTKTSSKFVAVGAFGAKAPDANVINAVYKTIETTGTDDKHIKLPAAFTGLNKPAPNEIYNLRIKKSGNTYAMTANHQTEVVTLNNLFSNEIYAGLYVAREANITFSNISITVDPRIPAQLTLDTSAMKKDYIVGQSLNLTGLQVTEAVYGALSPADYIVSGFDSSKAGTNRITVHFNGVSAPIDLNIIPLAVINMRVKYFPAKTQYYAGDPFDPQGLTVTADYNSGITTDLDSSKYSFLIPSATVTGATYTLNSPGTHTVKIVSTETPSMFTAFDVTVGSSALVGLEIAQFPQKTVYFLGESTLNLDGLVVNAKYKDPGSTSAPTSVRLLKGEYTVSALDTSTAGVKQVTITHKGQTVNLPLTVKQKELTGLKIFQYPKTTYTVGEAFAQTGLIVKKMYDDQSSEILPADQYTVDSSSFQSNQAGSYTVGIVPADSSLAPISFKVTVREAKTYEWKSIRFGQSTSNTNNTVTVNPNAPVVVTALEGGGKVTGDHDGISFYYTELDAAQDNFVLSADIKVAAYAKSPHDGQESFGIMARDAIGKSADSAVFASNIAAIGGYSGGTTKPNGTQLFVRTGITAPDGTGSKGIQSTMLNTAKPATSNTYPAAAYKLTLIKNNSGFTGKLNSINENGESFYFEPDLLKAQDDKMYVGFYAARLATIEVSNIALTVTAMESDPPKVDAPKVRVTPDLQILSLDKTPKTSYELIVKPNVNGTLTVKQGETIIATDKKVEAGKAAAIPATLAANSSSNMSITFLPDDTQYLTSYDKLIKNYTVAHKTYVDGGDIYVSPAGTSAGTGTEGSPLDLDTAIAFVREGQKIMMLDGRYVRSAKLDIKKYNDGTAQAKKYLIAAPGAKPIIDFDKKSEGVVLSGNYWHVKGIDVTRTAGNTKGFTVGGSYNIVENSRFYDNGDTGLQISRTDDSEDKALWPSYNLILNSESFDNRDPSDNNADGFAAKLTSGEGNIFRGTVAHHNIDDGWDLYTKSGSGAIGAVIIEDSIAYSNGTLTNGTVGAGDKNGFKLGGEGIHVPHIIRNSMAFNNGAYGFASNSNPGVIAQNNVAFNNAKGNMNFVTYSHIPTDFKISGFVSYQNGYTAVDSYPSSASSDTNYMFNGTESLNKSGVKLTDASFVSLAAPASFPRDTAGNLVWGDFLKPVAPAAVTAQAGNRRVDLTWTTVTGVTYYNVYRGTAETGSFEKVASLVTGNSFSNMNLNAGTTYYYKVTAQMAALESGYSPVVFARTFTVESSNVPGPIRQIPAPETTPNGVKVTLQPTKEVTPSGVTFTKVVVTNLGDAINAVKGAASGSQVITVDVQGTEAAAKVELTGEAVASAAKTAPAAVLSIQHQNVVYNLPVKLLDLAKLSGELGTDEKNVKVNVVVQKVEGSAANAVTAKASESGMSMLSAPVEFSITAEANGRTVTVNDFGTTYVERTITLPQSVNSSNATAILYNPATGQFSFVPAVFKTVDGKTEVTIKRTGNSMYSVVTLNKTFADLNGHWAKQDVELLASKLVVSGTTDTSFAPNARITRAEFAALLVRSLGFSEDISTKFADVRSSDWYAGVIGAASKAGLVNGFENGTFGPNETITREQMAVMIVRAMEFAGQKSDANAVKLDAFADSKSISGWAKAAAAGAVNAGIVIGVTQTSFAPSGEATRAEAAVMLKRLLQHVKFMN